VLALVRLSTQPAFLGTLAGVGVLVAILLLACAPDDFRDEQAAAETRTSAKADAGDGDHGQPASAAPGSAATGRPARPARGLWILSEGSVRLFDDPARIEDVLDRAERLGASDLFVQVYRGGRAFYPAGPGIERAPRVDALAEAGVDVLAQLLRAARSRDLRVHAWVNVLSLSTRLDAKMIEDLGSSAILVDRMGRSLLDYPDLELPEPDRRFYRMGTRGVYLDPAVPGVRDRLISTFRDLIERYPELDGLHLDYIRHPGVLPFSPGSRFGVGLEFGYGAETRARYRAETGRPDPIEGAPPGVVRSASSACAYCVISPIAVDAFR